MIERFTTKDLQKGLIPLELMTRSPAVSSTLKIDGGSSISLHVISAVITPQVDMHIISQKSLVENNFIYLRRHNDG